MLTLIYLHGFLSSPQSRKATLLADFIAAEKDPLVEVPLLPDKPALALRAAERTVLAAMTRGAVGLVGSSMGGFYATVLAERYNLSAVLVNPAVRPHRHLDLFWGTHTNPYTGAVTTIGASDRAVLAAAQPARLHPGRYWLLVQEGDEVLDYRDAVAYYHGSKMTVEPGGDHQFQRFERHLPELLKFLQCATGESASPQQ